MTSTLMTLMSVVGIVHACLDRCTGRSCRWSTPTRERFCCSEGTNSKQSMPTSREETSIPEVPVATTTGIVSVASSWMMMVMVMVMMPSWMGRIDGLGGSVVRDELLLCDLVRQQQQQTTTTAALQKPFSEARQQ